MRATFWTKPSPRTKHYENNRIYRMKDISNLERHIGFDWNDKNILRQALTHRSYLNEHSDCEYGHNERLEFLGDAVLELVVTDHLYNTYEDPEGILTNWRASLVNAETLADVAKELDVEEFLHMSRGEAQDANSKARRYILANAFEAIIGALYLDKGYDACSEFIHRILIRKLPFIIENKLYVDPKSRFQEVAQEKTGITPHYKVLKEEGPDHNKRFEIGVFLESDQIAVGVGSSKQEAQMDAAKNAIDAKQW